ncbi:hypothetical protein O4H48_14095 [Rhodobacteraceae bacterium G21628-S1]|nr:hypothetical protein [Rhodobacteraceae bacterium G21628-S1]
MPTGIFYVRESNKISHQMSGQLDTLLANQDEHMGVFIVTGDGTSQIDADTHYMKNGFPVVRPTNEIAEVSGQGWVFAAPPLGEMVAHIESRFVSGAIPLTAQAVSLAVPDKAQIRITAPWPYRETRFDLDGAPDGIIEGAQIILPDLDRMKTYYQQAVSARGNELADTMLGHPDQHTRTRWKLKRSILDRFLAGTNTAADEAAIAESVRYTSSTTQQELDRISAKVAFEDWVVMRTDGIRQETERRLREATNHQEVLTVINWAEAESTAAVAEANSKIN